MRSSCKTLINAANINDSHCTVKTIADESNDLFGITHMHSQIQGVHGGFLDDNLAGGF